MATYIAKEKIWKATWKDPETGKRLAFRGPTEAAAEAQKRQHVANLNAAGPTLSTSILFHDAAGALWWPGVETTVRPNTLRRYRDCYRLYVRPVFGDRPVDKITRIDTRNFANALTRQGLSASSVRNTMLVVRSVLKAAMEEGLLTFNAAERMNLPKSPKRKRALPLSEVLRIMGLVEGTNLAAPFFLAAVLGLRRGEVCGLKWEHMDFSRRRISISEQRLVRQHAKNGKAVTTGALKTESAERSFTLSQELWDALLRVGNQDSSYVATRTSRSGAWNPEHLTSAWAAKRDELGLNSDWHFHDLRHVAAGVLVSLGVDLLTVASILGHSSVDMTMLYAHAQEATAAKGFEKLSAAIFSREPSTNGTISHHDEEVLNLLVEVRGTCEPGSESGS